MLSGGGEEEEAEGVFEGRTLRETSVSASREAGWRGDLP